MSKTPIREYLDGYGDGIHGTPIYADDGEYYFINGNNIKDGKIIVDDNTLKISKQEYEKIKRPLSDNSLLISINGTLGNIGVYKGEKIALGKSACYLNVKDICNKYFVKYLLSTKEFQKYIMLVAHGSTIKNLAPSQIADYVPELPDDINADKVASLLKSIDDKIENNVQINKSLEFMAKTLYDYWFVQFDFPDVNGRPYKTSGGKMVWNEELGREIPAGWETGQVSDLGDVVAGGTPSTEHPEYFILDGIAWITPKDMSLLDGKYIFHGATDISEEGLKNSSAKLMPAGSVVYTTRAPIGYVAVAGNDVCTNQGFKSVVPKEHIGTEFVYYTLKSLEEHFKNVGNGSTFSEVSKETFSTVPICIPPQEIIREFRTLVNKWSHMQKKTQLENRKLIDLRDFLLPMLMNGQVTFCS
ncbi:type I restriction enzyme, S subunit [Selenomonas sp. GACV-9]|uniref:restriction endonuclease subunit S n=1 Tax=Selenomonas sp. GACV-9 TaxID=3158782 RepID=UPI0008E71854|nr:type I restriction enzyme, S subunit [Selenomonas ruminantium]